MGSRIVPKLGDFLDRWMERQGGRRGRTGTRTATGGLLWARTRHATSRAGDPNPHVHVLVANVTELLDARGGWRALDTAALRDIVHGATMAGRVASPGSARRRCSTAALRTEPSEKRRLIAAAPIGRDRVTLGEHRRPRTVRSQQWNDASAAALSKGSRLQRDCTVECNQRTGGRIIEGIIEEVRMALLLPEPRRGRLAGAQLDLVVCQVRHERSYAVRDAHRVLALHEALAGQYPHIEDVSAQELTIAAGPAGIQPVAGESSPGWRFRSVDGHWTVALMPDFFSLETTGYVDWRDFAPRLERLLAAVEAHLNPGMEKRVGLRYIDRLTEPAVVEPAGWAEWLDGSFLGAVVNPVLRTGLVQAQQTLELEAPDDIQVLLRHGCFRDAERDQAWTYMLDHDCFLARGRRFTAGDVVKTAEQLHTVSLGLFQTIIKPEMYEYLQAPDKP